MVELKQFPRERVTLRFSAKVFVNALRILNSIDEFELAHLNWPKAKRDTFFDDPERFLFVADDPTVDALFDIIEQRFPKRVADQEAAPVLPLFASIPKDMPPDPTAQTEPLTIGQQIVASWETDAIAEPCELAGAIDRAIREARTGADELAAEVINHDCAEAVQAEREACAAIADEIAAKGGIAGAAAASVAAAIRGRT